MGTALSTSNCFGAIGPLMLKKPPRSMGKTAPHALLVAVHAWTFMAGGPIPCCVEIFDQFPGPNSTRPVKKVSGCMVTVGRKSTAYSSKPVTFRNSDAGS